MSRNSLLLAATALVITIGGLCAAVDRGTVTLHAVDEYGRGLGPVKVRKFRERRIGGSDYSSRFKDGLGDGIPFGDYIASVTAGGRDIGGPVSVYSERSFIVLSGPQFVMDYGPGRSPVLRGRVTGVPENQSGPVWVRLMDLYHDHIQTLRTDDKDGSFLVPLSEAGAYIVAVLSDSGVLYSGVLKIEDPRSVVEVNVGTGRLTVIPVR